MGRTKGGTHSLLLCGDVMLGRGIDQIMKHPVSPEIYEGYLKNAKDYIALAEKSSGHIPRQVLASYIWGELLSELTSPNLDARIINLETAVTKGGEPWPGKGIHYRMNPAHLDCLKIARINCCELANNHVLDWGYPGLEDTIESLRAAGICHTGAGKSLDDACCPAIISNNPKGRVLVFAYGMGSSGVPDTWAADRRPGINWLPDLSDESVERVANQIGNVRCAGDSVIVGVHWGPNWGYEIPAGHQEFAHKLIDRASVDILHGHSSHHVASIEVYHHKLILYGCGDLLNDYEGIGNFGSFRGELGLMYFPTLNARSGDLEQLTMIPTRIRRFQIVRANEPETTWLKDCLNSISSGAGTHFTEEKGQLVIH